MLDLGLWFLLVIAVGAISVVAWCVVTDVLQKMECVAAGYTSNHEVGWDVYCACVDDGQLILVPIEDVR